MAKITITFEDKGAKSVSFLTEVEGDETADKPVTSAMAMALATRAMFENGMITQAAFVALNAMQDGVSPADAVKEYYGSKT